MEALSILFQMVIINGAVFSLRPVKRICNYLDQLARLKGQSQIADCLLYDSNDSHNIRSALRIGIRGAEYCPGAHFTR